MTPNRSDLLSEPIKCIIYKIMWIGFVFAPLLSLPLLIGIVEGTKKSWFGRLFMLFEEPMFSVSGPRLQSQS